jgi:hypothetical protein
VLCHTQEIFSFLVATSRLVKKSNLKFGKKNAKGRKTRKKMGIIAYNGKVNGE